MDAEEVRSSAEREFRRMKLLADRALEQVGDKDFFRTLSPDDNNLAVLVKHLAGNMRSRWRDFLTADGEKPDRDRDDEFVIWPDDTRASLMQAWEEGWQHLFDVVTALTPAQIEGSRVSIRREEHSVTEALHRQLSHYGYHVGQIVFLAKHHAAGEWTTLSIPRGDSQSFNQQRASYLASRADDVPPGD
jgi:hypothetical protein